ncbi:MAG: hypothetical protein E7543_01550 [Ruminococcaceae bacterium]|nr:hypothetical protein [Oscillospiraceae bacterium]
MSKNNKSVIERIIYNNKLLMVFCLIISVILWAAVKINYSAETTRTISDVKIAVTVSSDSSELVPFIGEEELYAEVVVSGKAYNINSYALTKDDIVIEASAGYIDSAGFKVLNLNVKSSETGDLSDVEVVSVSPSAISVYFDRKATQTFNVEARITNELTALAEEGYTVGQPVPSMSTVDVSGPATILNKMSKVYFEGSVMEEDLPLTHAKVIPADISYELESKRYEKYLVCESINDESNPATVTIPLYVTKNVPTQVKFINQPAYFAENPPKVKITPSELKVTYNPAESEGYEFITVGTVDFRTLLNKVNTFEFEIDEKLISSGADASFGEFRVSIDMSDMSQKSFDITGGKVVLLNQIEGYTYSVDTSRSNFDNVVVIGPEESLKKISADDIQVEINVSSLSLRSRATQSIEVSNISIVNEEISDCWIYGKYNAVIGVSVQ